MPKSQSQRKTSLDIHSVKALRISLASSEQIRSWSSGEILKAETINYRSLKPETDGLLCERVFGPVKNWTCGCGKYKRYRYKGTVCEKCGVEVAPSLLRRMRMGHIELAAPICHPWYARGIPSKISVLLDLPQRTLENLLANQCYIVVSVDDAALLSKLYWLEKEIERLTSSREELIEEEAQAYASNAETESKDVASVGVLQLSGRGTEVTHDLPQGDGSMWREGAQKSKSPAMPVPISEQSNEPFSIESVTKDSVLNVSSILGDLQALAGYKLDGTRQKKLSVDMDGEEILPTENLSSVLGDLRALASSMRGEMDQVEQVKQKVRQVELEESVLEPTAEQLAAIALFEEQEYALNSYDIQQQIKELRQAQEILARLLPQTILTIEEYRLVRRECASVFQAGTGSEVIETLLASLDLDQLASVLRHEMDVVDSVARPKVVKRLKIVEGLRRSQIRPEWMVLHAIPVLPPDLRPVLVLSGGRFASSDLNELYIHIIQCNNRLKRFQAIDAPDLMIFREKQALQHACDALFDNGHLAHPRTGPNRRPLRSLSDSLSGKDGRFRRNLLGKRVDFSGRSVISVGLDLKIHQCGLPKKIAMELFKPFLIHKLVAYNYCETPRQAKHAVERHEPMVWDVLDEVMSNRVVLLNRAPTLHRLSIQAFEPVLVEGNAIRLHPQVCSAFNADFDGDQMAVHLPLSPQAQQEARELMLSSRNLLSPASGEPSISVTQEQVLGCYYLTQERPGAKGEQHVFADVNDALQGYAHGIIDLQARIFVRMRVETIYEQPPPSVPVVPLKGTRIATTVGRLIFNEVLPKKLGFRNYAMKKDFLKQLVFDAIKQCGMQRAAVMANEIKRLGFSYATKSGLSFSILSDIEVPPQKKELLLKADNEVAELRDEWTAGLITREELYERSIEVWKEVTDQIASHIQVILDPYGSISTIANSGATKAKLQQIRQLSGMRGLMASPSGAIIETPVRGNFLEGLSVAEYFLSSHGARKSMMDRSLNTAQSGYLTIQLVNAAQDVIVTEEDCGTQEGWLVCDEDSKKIGLTDSSSRLIGRVLAEDVPSVGLCVGDELDEGMLERVQAARIDQVRVRSVLTCQTVSGVCRKCYGWDLSRRALVVLGTAVGIIAAQSIGEPGTQLTMRTFHSGGIAGGQGDITQGIPRVKELFGARIPTVQAITSEIEGVVTVETEAGIHRVQVNATDRSPLDKGKRSTKTYVIPAARKLLVKSGQHVRAYEPLTAGQFDPHKMLRTQGREALANYLLQEAQLVYRMTGAYIHDKHFEVMIRQMLRYVRVEEPGDTSLLPGDLIDHFAYESVNTHVLAQGGGPAVASPVLLGLVQATLATESWLAAASFQHTAHILAAAALEGQTDYLRGLKENVIVGKMIPAGTGLLARSLQRTRTAIVHKRRGRPPKA